jgi:hypothetical protein
VIPKAKWLAVEGAGGVKDSISVDVTPVSDGYSHFSFRPEGAVEKDYISLLHQDSFSLAAIPDIERDRVKNNTRG